MGVARDERAQLSDLFTAVGPDAPTLCGDWKTRDLAAHLVVRERRPDAAGGILVKALAGYLRKVQDGYAAKPWPELVDLVRSGPPLLSIYRPALLDELINTTEYYVHHEDVRRAVPGWEPRPADNERDRALWVALKRSGRMFFRNSPVGVNARTPSGRHVDLKSGPNTVTLVGEPGELLLFAFGRDECRIEFEGEQSSISVVSGLNRGL
ncbi:TIGR03085 family metal-binding protein [Actinokineospora xionganensis]|uniref:TIGR03085 family protein n=1 Tax=Actinokineospora xionganensis TaxID=2684470 RepID=A0ABR7L9N5_9PSEU|nr:TIGR03085 family metal-binding protein [Actinokineospora xionganensis]MBC6449405.1 TIGR03085 family protein [Actinokineospora xionganensis]